MSMIERIIKFRAWDTKKKKWLDAIPPEEYMLDEDAWNHSEEDDLMFYPKDPLREFDGRIIYNQYVDLLDKNGKEIYEGDKVESNGVLWTIEYGTIFDRQFNEKDCVVVGNIYEDGANVDT